MGFRQIQLHTPRLPVYKPLEIKRYRHNVSYINKHDARWKRWDYLERKITEVRIEYAHLWNERKELRDMLMVQEIESKGILTTREKEVFMILQQDINISNKEIAAIMKITERTVKFYIAKLFAKTQTTSRAELFTVKFVNEELP
jgi:DNA-binding CsgD family transcriptional regulator